MSSTTRRSLLINGVLALAGSTAALASLPLDGPSDGPDFLDAHAVAGQPGYDPDMLRHRWTISLDGRVLLHGRDGYGRGQLYIKGADQRAGYVDMYDQDAAGHFTGDITRHYGKVRIIRGERD